ncbi:MAG: 30S ribosomal protein S11 [Bacilli bacterium]
MTNKVKTKKRANKNLDHGQVHIKSTFNNTIVTVTDEKGNVVAWSSSGSLGFRASKKDTPYASALVAETAGKKAAALGLKSVDVYVKGAGRGREAAIRALTNAELEVTSIKDVSSITFNGCRPPKARRI